LKLAAAVKHGNGSPASLFLKHGDGSHALFFLLLSSPQIADLAAPIVGAGEAAGGCGVCAAVPSIILFAIFGILPWSR